MTIRLRPHHLLCMLTYVGKGYSAAFTDNYDLVIKRLGDGEDILVVDGPDDVCAPLLADADPHCHWPTVLERDARAAADLAAITGLPLHPGASLVLDAPTLLLLRSAFADRRSRAACAGCEWSDLCDRIADDAFPGVKLQIACDRP